MYLRYLAKYYHVENERTQFGFFWAADYLIKHGTLSVEDRNKLETTIKWFDDNLPIPEYYQDKKNRQIAKSATSWFKDSATEFIRLMNELTPILERHFVTVTRLSSRKLLGKIIFEDKFQITILPHREVAKKVK